jgi:DNA-binding beta-propeller fold protein YncE
LVELRPRERRGVYSAKGPVPGEGEGALARLAALSALVALMTSCCLGALLAMSASSAGAAGTVYVANISSGSVSAYSIGSGGGLSPISGSPFAGGVGPLGVAVTPDGEHLYVTNVNSKNVSAYSIGSGGGLSPISGSPFATGTEPWGVAVAPDGEHLYVVNRGPGSVSAYSIGSGGGLSPVPGSPFPTGTAPGDIASNGVAVTPDGKHLYVTNMGGGGSVTAFSITPSGGLIPVAGSPFDAGATARPISVSPDGEHLYVGNHSSDDISMYSIGADGALSPLAGSPFAIPVGPLGLTVTPDGAHLYVAHVNAGNNVRGYSIGPDGGLSDVVGSPFPTGSWRGNSITVTPDSKHLYTTNNGLDNLSAYSIGSGGSLSPVPGSPFATGAGPLQIVVTPDQGPLAAYSATPTPAGNASLLDASASSDPDGTVASYHWDFGDGQTQVAAAATIGHVYTSPGNYTVTLTVVDDAGCSTAQIFTGQTVSCNGSPLAQISHEITVPPGVPLGISLSGSGSGSVTSSPSGITCPGACSYAYLPDTEVTLAASAAPGSTFTGWSGGGCSGTESVCEVSVSEAETVTAEFTIDTYALSVTLEGLGSGEVNSSPAGIDGCEELAASCNASYDYGTVVTLSANPAEGSTLTGWSGGGCSGTGTCNVTVDADTGITATFGKAPPPLIPDPALPPPTTEIPVIESSPLSARLRIGRIGSQAISSRCRTRLLSAPRLIESECPRLRLAVGGTIVKEAWGAVSVKASTYQDGRRVTATQRARILDGRWVGRLALAGLAPDGAALVKVDARFEGSPGVRGDRARRRVELPR